LPKTPAEREKTLSDLYALLATSDDEETAKAITTPSSASGCIRASATIDLLMERSIKAMAEKKVDLALKLLDHVVELAPDYTEAWTRRAYVHFVRNDIERALGDLRRTLALDPASFQGAGRPLARSLREIGQKKAALRGLQGAARRAPLLVGRQAGRRGARARGRRPRHLRAFEALGRAASITNSLKPL